jgi:hypothetical protein
MRGRLMHAYDPELLRKSTRRLVECAAWLACEDGAARNGSVNKSAKVVLVRISIRQVRESLQAYRRFLRA